MNHDTMVAINTLISNLNFASNLKSNIEVVWALEQLSKDALAKANEIRYNLESEQAKD